MIAHYEKKHPDMTDELILELISQLDGTQYFALTTIWQDKDYRIVLNYCEEDFLGVVNAFRV